ncbi:MAG: hypothetical protein Q8Q08_06545 [Candidatus Omnitrophota bacterium]|nr:hypothetical protein [Candidatus Omnitrophota bacterium]MDZ4243270.1 hypothetical protein [Candidatus Omnitrophota bacterium]
MSRAARLSLGILVALLIGSFLFAGLTLSQKLQLEQEKQGLLKNIDEYQLKERNLTLEKNQLAATLKDVEAKKNELENKLGGLDTNISSLNEKLEKFNSEVEEQKKQIETLRAERDNLLVKLEEKPKEKVVFKYIEKPADETAPPAGQETGPAAAQPPAPKPADKPEPAVPVIDEGDEYWAAVLKQKAALEVELNNVKDELSRSQVELGELKKQNGDLQLELNGLKGDKETIEREIKYGQDLADTLSLDLARAKNDKKFMGDRLDRITKENAGLRQQIKELTSTKVALEKSIVKLQDEKKSVEKRMAETENLIQNRIDEIWKIKETLEKSFKPAAKSSSSSSIQLPPIVVSAHGGDSVSPVSSDEPPSAEAGALDGRVVSVNADNNFVIVDAGESAGIKIGDILHVYHGSEYVAELSVIQVRKDIAAADIREKAAEIQVGDSVR